MRNKLFESQPAGTRSDHAFEQTPFLDPAAARESREWTRISLSPEPAERGIHSASDRLSTATNFDFQLEPALLPRFEFKFAPDGPFGETPTGAGGTPALPGSTRSARVSRAVTAVSGVTSSGFCRERTQGTQSGESIEVSSLRPLRSLAADTLDPLIRVHPCSSVFIRVHPWL